MNKKEKKIMHENEDSFLLGNLKINKDKLVSVYYNKLKISHYSHKMYMVGIIMPIVLIIAPIYSLIELYLEHNNFLSFIRFASNYIYSTYINNFKIEYIIYLLIGVIVYILLVVSLKNSIMKFYSYELFIVNFGSSPRLLVTENKKNIISYYNTIKSYIDSTSQS